jgi:TPR repeat protein
MKPGTYKVKIENKEYGISDEAELVVSPGKDARLEKDYREQLKPSHSAVSQQPVAVSPGGIPLTPDEEEWKRQADEAKEAEGAYRYGKSRLAKGEIKEAAVYFKIAADRGHALAQCELGKMYYEGKGIAMSIEGSVYWLLKSAGQQNQDALEFLKTRKFPQDFSDAIITQRRISSNDPNAQKLRRKQELFLDDLKDKVPN